MADTKLELMSSAPKPLAAPRGPMITAARIVAEFFVDDAGKNLVSVKWVRENVPNKIKLSHSRVAWYRRDVETWIDSRKVG